MPLALFEQFLGGLKTFNAEAEMQSIVENNASKVSELLQEQLSYGKDITGANRVDEYRPLTIYLKKKLGVGLGAVTDRVTFFQTGNLYGSLRTQIRGKMFEVESPLPTFAKMVKRIGNEDYGLDHDQRYEFATEITLPQFSAVLKQKTGLTISK